MKLHLLGSSAGKTVPRPFCSCRVCQAAIEHGGRDLRTRTSLHIYPENAADMASQNVPYKVDLSPDTGHHMIQHQFNLSCLEHLLITHPHGDHFAPEYLAVRPSILSDTESMPYLNVYGGQNTIDSMTRAMPDLERFRIRAVVVQPFTRFQAGELDVFPLRAAHLQPAEAFNFVIQWGEQTVLLAWDTGMWAEETWAAATDFVFDAVFLECTALGPGTRASGVSHNGLESFLKMRDRLGKEGCLKTDAPFVAVHIGDNGLLTHDEAQELMASYGVTVGYDGMWLEL